MDKTPPISRRMVLGGAGLLTAGGYWVLSRGGYWALWWCDEVGPTPVVIDGTNVGSDGREVSVTMRRDGEVVFEAAETLTDLRYTYDDALPKACPGAEFETTVVNDGWSFTQSVRYVEPPAEGEQKVVVSLDEQFGTVYVDANRTWIPQ